MFRRSFLLWFSSFSYSFTYNVIFGENPLGWWGEAMTPEITQPEFDRGRSKICSTFYKTVELFTLKTLTSSTIQYFWLFRGILLILRFEYNKVIHANWFLLRRRKKHQYKRQPNELNETLNDFIVRNNTNAGAIGNKTLELRTSGLVNNFGRPTVDENSAHQDQVIEKNFAVKIREEVDNAVMVVENRVHDAILSAMDNVLIPKIEMAVRSIT